MKKKFIIATIVVLISIIFMFIFKDIKYRFLIICIASILVSQITRKIT